MTVIPFENDRFIRAGDVRRRYGISNPTLHRWTKTGKLPKPEYLNHQRVWRESELLAAEMKMLQSPRRNKCRIGVA